MKVLFLDVDGVLNSWAHPAHIREIGGRMGIAPEHAAHLLRIVWQTDCKIVVSSTWRLGGIGPGSDFAVCMETADPSRKILDAVIGCTPCGHRDGILHRGFVRGDEIKYWLVENHPFNGGEHIERFAILDDDSDMGALLPHLFKTDFATGLTEQIADEVIAWLNGGDRS